MIVTAICGVLAGGIWLMNRRGSADVAMKPAAHEEARPASTSNPSAASTGEQHSDGEATSDPAITPSQPPVQQTSNSPDTNGPAHLGPATPDETLVPANEADDLVGRVSRSTGIALYDVAPETLIGLGLQPGAVVATARRAAGEAEIGRVLQADDVITRLGEHEIRCSGDLWLALAEIKPGETASVEIDRYPRQWLRTQLGLPTTSPAEESERNRGSVLWRYLGRSGKDMALSLSVTVQFN
jgi:hypothetical protein